tara:strand:- start:1085 stop:1513 length:429 start_codon:yes stop_codon:yes gene_type:complete
MTFQVHSSPIERHYDGTESLDLDGVGAITVNMGIVTEAAIDPDTNTLYSGLTAVATNVGWTGPVAVANLVCGLDGSFDLLFDADDPAQVPYDAAGFANGRSIVLYLSGTSYIIASHINGVAFGNNVGPINISWPNGIWKNTI